MHFFIFILFQILIPVDPDQMPCSVVSDLGLHCLPVSHLLEARHIWVNLYPAEGNGGQKKTDKGYGKVQSLRPKKICLFTIVRPSLFFAADREVVFHYSLGIPREFPV